MSTTESDNQAPLPKSQPSKEDKGLLYWLVQIGLRMRFINLLAVGCSFVGALCMCAVGLMKTIKAVMVFVSPDTMFDDAALNSVSTYVAHAMDAFLVATVLVVFSTGIFHLFIMELKESDFKGLRGFERVSSIRGLKKILGELIVVVLFVHFMRLAIEGTSFDWTILVIPVGALLMAGALRLLKLDDDQEPSTNR